MFSRVDQRLLLALNGLRSPWLDAVLAPLASYGLYAFPLLMLGALFRGSRHARSVRDGWLAWFVALTLTESVLKPLVARPRPTADAQLRALLNVLGAVPGPTSLSFPSGTSAAAFAGATWIALRFGPRAGTGAALLALLVGLSRVYGGVHWPSDVLVGALLGAGVALGWDRVARRIDRAPAASSHIDAR